MTSRTPIRPLLALLGALLAVAAATGPARAGSRSEAGPVPRGRVAALVELGRRLFFDPAVSRSGIRSCASCHDPDHGFSDPLRRSEDDFLATARHSQTLLDAADNPSAHWDGEFASIEDLVVARLGVPSGSSGGYGGSPSTPGRQPVITLPDGRRALPPVTTPGGERARPVELAAPPPAPPTVLDLRRLERVDERLEAAGRYREAVAAAFGSGSVTTARLAEAIGAYVRTIRSTPSAFDRHVAGDVGALTPAARRGFALFTGEAGCSACHLVEGRRPAFTDYAFHNTGVSWKTVLPHVESGASELALDAMDVGRERISTSPGDRRTFKTPTLRDVARRGPYMHDGSLDTLEDVVRYYDRGGSGDPRRSQHVRPLHLDDGDVADLVAFLESLTGEVQPGLAPTLWRTRAPQTTLRFVDGRGRPLPGLAVTLRPEGDVLPGDLPVTSPVLELTTDDRGRIRFTPPHRTHVRVHLPDDLPLEGGSLVPDTCRRADVLVPVDGTVRLVVSWPEGRDLPDRLVAHHATELPLPPANRPRTVFHEVGRTTVHGRVVARFEAPLRTDAEPDVVIDVPWPTVAAGLRVRLTTDDDVRIHLD